jgi:uncharacterized protein
MNCFEGARQYPVEDVREAMAISPEVPIVKCDARKRESTKQALITMVQHAMLRWQARDVVRAF